MRNAARQPADGLEVLTVAQLLFLPVELLLSPLALGHVDEEGEHAALPVHLHHLERSQELHRLSGLGPAVDVEAGYAALGQEPRDQEVPLRPIPPRPELASAGADHLVALVAEHVERGLVHVEDASIGESREDHAGGAGVESRREALLRLLAGELLGRERSFFEPPHHQREGRERDRPQGESLQIFRVVLEQLVVTGKCDREVGPRDRGACQTRSDSAPEGRIDHEYEQDRRRVGYSRDELGEGAHQHGDADGEERSAELMKPHAIARTPRWLPHRP